MVEALTESFGIHNLPLGGRHRYKGVRGSQGRKKNKFQGYTPKKTHFTKLVETAVEAAVDLAIMKNELEQNSDDDATFEKKLRKRRVTFGKGLC